MKVIYVVIVTVEIISFLEEKQAGLRRRGWFPRQCVELNKKQE